MAIPDTGTFTLIDVTDEFGLSDSDGLQDCFTDSVDGDFDVLYKGSKDRLSNFRNYGYNGFRGFVGGQGNAVAVTACNVSWTTQYYHDGANLLPVVGDKVYSTFNGSVAVGNNYYGSPNGELLYISDGLGTVASITICVIL